MHVCVHWSLDFRAFHDETAFTRTSFILHVPSKIWFPSKPKSGHKTRKVRDVNPKDNTTISEKYLISLPVTAGLPGSHLCYQLRHLCPVSHPPARKAASRSTTAVKPGEPLPTPVPTGTCHLAASRPWAEDAKG